MGAENNNYAYFQPRGLIFFCYSETTGHLVVELQA